MDNLNNTKQRENLLLNELKGLYKNVEKNNFAFKRFREHRSELQNLISNYNFPVPKSTNQFIADYKLVCSGIIEKLTGKVFKNLDDVRSEYKKSTNELSSINSIEQKKEYERELFKNHLLIQIIDYASLIITAESDSERFNAELEQQQELERKQDLEQQQKLKVEPTKYVWCGEKTDLYEILNLILHSNKLKLKGGTEKLRKKHILSIFENIEFEDEEKLKSDWSLVTSRIYESSGSFFLQYGANIFHIKRLKEQLKFKTGLTNKVSDEEQLQKEIDEIRAEIKEREEYNNKH